MNKDVIVKIENQNQLKNSFIKSTYWFNPISCYLNKWNSLTSTDYESYYNFRKKIQEDIDKKMKLMVYECWDEKSVNKLVFEQYLNQLGINFR